MCIVVFGWQTQPKYTLILLFNRDEYHNRGSKSVKWWEGVDEKDIVGGRDELAGGTWLACSRTGRLAFLTNVLELNTLSHARTRGDLPVRFLQSKKSPQEFADELVKEVHQYNGFNLVMADLTSKTMAYVSNRPKGEAVTVQDVEPGIHVLSNAKLNSPWPKARRLRVRFKELLATYGEGEIQVKEMIEKLMRDKAKADDESELPHICSLDWEYNLSSVFVEVDTPLGLYGTRSTIALTVTSLGEVSLLECYLDDNVWKEQTVNYIIDIAQ